MKSIIGEIDIYLIDQILKERYAKTDKILDAGCGSGRNLKWFYNTNYTICGVDNNTERLEFSKRLYPNQKENFILANVEDLPFESETYEHIICSAVLHFAKDNEHFILMFSELVRLLKPGGTLFIRMTSNIGIENAVKLISNGIYKLPDTTERFLLTRTLLKKIMITYRLSFLEPVKTVNVNDLRCMTTLVLQK